MNYTQNDKIMSINEERKKNMLKIIANLTSAGVITGANAAVVIAAINAGAMALAIIALVSGNALVAYIVKKAFALGGKKVIIAA